MKEFIGSKNHLHYSKAGTIPASNRLHDQRSNNDLEKDNYLDTRQRSFQHYIIALPSGQSHSKSMEGGWFLVDVEIGGKSKTTFLAVSSSRT